MRVVRLTAAALLAAALAAAPALAAQRSGTYLLPNKGTNRMPPSRAEKATKKVIRLNYKVKPGSDIYACNRVDVNEADCDFALRLKSGVYTCGNAKVDVNDARIRVRYTSKTKGCGDF